MQTMGRKLIVLLTMISLFLIGCEQEQGPEEVYKEYMELAKVSYAEAKMKYGHFEDEETKQLLSESTNYVISYEILSVEKLNDKLWAINAKTLTKTRPDSWFIFTNFVGMIDGTYKVMGNSDQIPAELKEGLDLEKYDAYATEPIANDETSG